MKAVRADFPQLKSIKVIVEERRIGLEVDPANWRTHQYQGLGEIPERIRPAFASRGTEADLDLAGLVRRACVAGKDENIFEEPYFDGAGKDKKTVLRTVIVHLYLK